MNTSDVVVLPEVDPLEDDPLDEDPLEVDPPDVEPPLEGNPAPLPVVSVPPFGK